jgi:nucleoside-diphosphate-sugar epimerase
MNASVTRMTPFQGKRAPGLSESACNYLRRDERRIIITGAGGWIGRATLDLLFRCLGLETARDRVRCFGSSFRHLEVGPGITLDQLPLSAIHDLPKRPSIVLHLAFVTKDKVAGMAEDDYRRANRELSREVSEALGRIGADRLFVASSGAADYAEDPEASPDLRLYGRLKRDDEELFANWAAKRPGRRAAIARIYSLSGPHINKHQTYALASFIVDALAGQAISIKAQVPVTRSYVAVRELMSLVFSSLLADEGEQVLRFDSGGDPHELGELARCIATAIGPVPINRAPICDGPANHYVGDGRRYRELLAQHRIEHVDLVTQVLETAAFIINRPEFTK